MPSGSKDAKSWQNYHIWLRKTPRRGLELLCSEKNARSGEVTRRKKKRPHRGPFHENYPELAAQSVWFVIVQEAFVPMTEYV